MRLLRYCVRESGVGMRRNAFLSLATVFTAAVAFFVLAVFLLGAANLNNLIDHVERQVQVSIYLKDGVSQSQRQSVIAAVDAVDGVRDVTFVSREDALARLRNSFGDNAALLEGIEEFNPLRDAVEVQMADADAVSAVVTAVKGNAAVDEVSYGKELVARLITMTRALRVGILSLAGLLGFATLFLVQNSVRLSVFARRDEISIMRLVGATDGVIRLPFVFEGMALASWGAIVAAIAVAVGYTWLTRTVGRSMAFVPVLPAFGILSGMLPLLVILGALIGAIGAMLALRRWLRD